MPKRLKGINTDVDQIDQPQGTYRNAENAVLTERLGAVTSEGGNVLRDSIPAGFEILGDTLVYDGRQIIFLTDGTNSEVGVFNGQTYSTILSDKALNFQTGSVIEATNIINNQNEVVVYWTDDINPPRFYNIDADEGFTDIDNLNLFPTIGKVPEINLNQISSSGGTLDSGAYHFLVSYISEDQSRTNYLSATPAVLINDDSDPDKHDVYDGVPAGTQTSKSIQLEFTNLDQSYENIQIAVVRKEGNTIGSVELLPELAIQDDTLIYTYTGSENTIQSSLQEVVINTASYETARTIVEQDNTLYLGNLSAKPDIGYQKYANNIKVSSTTKQLEDGNATVEEGAHFGDPEFAFYDSSFKRGEVYAFYISFVLKDGKESQAYHIPGRPVDGSSETSTSTFGVKKYKLLAEMGTNDMGFWENENETYPNSEDFQVWDVDSNGDGFQKTSGVTDLGGDNVRHHHFPEVQDRPIYDNSRKFQTLGVVLNDVKIPANIINQVTGVKLYYAKRTDNNRRVVDQGLAYCLSKESVNNSFFDGDPGPNIPDEFVLRHERVNGNDSEIEVDGVFVHAFNALRTRKNIGSVTHFKQVAEGYGNLEDYSKGSTNNIDLFIDQTENIYQNFTPIVADVKAITYCEPDSFINNAIGAGFSYNISNIIGAPMIAAEFESTTALNIFNDQGNYDDVEENETNVTFTKVVDMIQLQDDMFFPFDQQELVWTGYIETNMDVFDPRVNVTGGGQASGSIDITSGAEDEAPYPTAVITVPSDADFTGDFAEGYIEVTNVDFQGTEDHTVNVDGNTVGPITIEGIPGLINTVDISANSTDPYSIQFKPDGTTMYILSAVGDRIDEYSLSTAWDITTATQVDFFDISTQDNLPAAFNIQNNGTKLYLVGQQNNNIYEYDLGTAWDVSTATFLQSFDIATQTTSARGMDFKPDGTKVYVMSNGDGTIYEYTLSTPFNITTATLTTSYDASAQDTDLNSMTIGDSGTKLYIVGDTNDNIYEYNLGVAWDISSASFVTAFSVGSEDTTPDGMFIKPDGSRLFVTGSLNDNLYEYELYTPWSLEITDTPQSVVTKYRDAINGDVTISADWTATVSNASGQWRTIITADERGTQWNNKTIDVTGEVGVTLTTSNTSGGVDETSPGDIDITINSPEADINLTISPGSGESKDSIAVSIGSSLAAIDVFDFAFDANIDTNPTDPTVTIVAKSNGSYYNSTLSITDTSGANPTADGNIDGGVDSGLLTFRQSIGYIDVLSDAANVGSSDIEITMESPPFRNITDTVTVTVDDTDTDTDIAGKIFSALNGSSALSEYTFFVYQHRVYAYYDDNNSYQGVGWTFQTASGDDVSFVVNLESNNIANGRSGYGSTPSIRISFTTPNDSFFVDVGLTVGDTAAEVETKTLNALQAHTTFSSYYSASGSDPINIIADQAGTEYNGNIDLIDNDTGVQATIQDLDGGQDPSVVGQFTFLAYGGDTFINFIGFRQATMFTDGVVTGYTFYELYYCICESDDNIKLRHQGEGKEEIYYPKSAKTDVLRFEKDILTDQDPDDLQYNNFIGYNPDYSALAEVKSAVPSAKDSEGITEYPTRVIRSAEGDQTQGDTGIRTFLENDFIDLTKSRGELVTLVVMQNTLMPHMERSLIRTRGREELTTGDFRAFIGAGDIFSVKPDEILSTREGFAGLQDQTCSMVTPTGYFFVDREAGQIFLMSETTPEIISENGLRNFFQEELEDAGPDELICGYDNEWNRIMLTRKGHWTISYYPALKAWGSFHSYDPEYYLYDLNTFYTLKSDNLYEHNIDNDPCHFYGATDPDDFEFEFVSNPKPQLTKKFYNIQFITDVEDTNGNTIWDETFDKFQVKNDRQDSGVQDIVYFTGANGNARNVEGTWKINNFRNMLVNGSVDMNKSWQDQDRFISKWLQVRLIFNNLNQKSIYLYDAGASARPSKR